MRQRYRLPITVCILLLTLLAALRGRTTEKSNQQADYLQELSLPFRDWRETRQALTARERELLLPDAVLLRQYRSSSGDIAELAVLAGHRKQTVHTPAFCMAGGGWHTISQRDVTFTIEGTKITATQSFMENEKESMLATYFFTNGFHSHQNLVRFQMEQYLDRIKGNVPLGALVRVIVPIRKGRGDAEKLSDDFAKDMLPELMKKLRNAQSVQ